MSARQELDRLCHESWTRLGQDLRSTGNSMGRIGLSCARRHPALLLGGGALLAFGVTMWLTRGKRHAKHTHDHERDHDGGRDDARASHDRESKHERSHAHHKDSFTKAFAMGAVTSILKSAARMWLLQHLSSAIGPEEEEPSEAEAPAETAA